MVKIDKKTILIIIGVLLIGFACWYLFGLHDNGGRVDSIRSELDEVKQYQQSATKRLDKIEAGLNSSANRLGGVSERITTNTERIVTVERRIEADQTGLTESAKLINNSQSILSKVRERGQK